VKSLFIGCDHAAFDEKEELKLFLTDLGFSVTDCGTKVNERCNYPDYASAVAKEVAASVNACGILLCGSGIGVSMVANRFAGIRAALCRTREDAKLSRAHNDANILCVGARLTQMSDICEITKVWLESKFEQGRHSDRIELFNNLGEK